MIEPRYARADVAADEPWTRPSQSRCYHCEVAHWVRPRRVLFPCGGLLYAPLGERCERRPILIPPPDRVHYHYGADAEQHVYRSFHEAVAACLNAFAAKEILQRADVLAPADVTAVYLSAFTTGVWRCAL